MSDIMTKEHIDTKRVLVVEDENEVRNLFCEVVSKCGFTAIEACNGEEALEKIAAWDRIDAVILDIKMPKMHGYNVINKLREKEKEIPIIVCTAYIALKEDISVMTYPNITTMEKPVSLKTLENKLIELMSGPV